MLVVVTVGAAALVSHAGIDMLGDFLLPHDTYDDVAHASRSLLCCAGLALLGTAAVWLLCGALDEVARREHAGERLDVRRRYPVAWHLMLVVGGTLALLVGMEYADVTLAGRSISDAGDLLGGSLPLGTSVVLAIACAFAFATWQIADWALGLERALVRAISAWFTTHTRRPDAAASRARRARPTARVAAGRVRSVAKRGPPLPAM
jgi:Trk-type K+ transport system membrane component